ncbi:hypothetical protein [Achromobacter sp. DH1f]|uniref:hypothetical protein n=1 Tax=Achromobacter sp. DH1f TaxID=1397275 RepID=UPI000469DEB8|nr:hypothetical protein [Achromobacter sp. DH1f]
MTDQNNATQPVLTDDEIRTAAKAAIRDAKEQGLANAGPHEYIAAGAAALLSKLRAEGVPVDDEVVPPPIAPDDEAISECWISASDCDGIAYDGPSFQRGYRAGEIAERDRATGAAPVASATADERALTTEQRKEFIRRASFISEADHDTRAAFVDEIASATLASAPVAGWSLRGPSAGSWRGEFSRRVYENLAAADNQDVPLEEYPARILAVLDAMGAPVAGELVTVEVYVYREGNRYLASALLPNDTPLRPGLNTLYAAPQASEAAAAVRTLQAKCYTYHGGEQWKPPLGDAAATVARLDKIDAYRIEAMYLLREAGALLPTFTTAEEIGAWREKVRKFGAGDVIDVPPQTSEYERGHAAGWAAGWDQAIKQPQASQAVRNAALELAAGIVGGTCWAGYPMWVSELIAKHIRALKQPQADKDGGQQHARNVEAAWAECRADVGTGGWTVSETINYHGFFLHGWRAALSATQTEQGERDA